MHDGLYMEACWTNTETRCGFVSTGYPDIWQETSRSRQSTTTKHLWSTPHILECELENSMSPWKGAERRSATWRLIDEILYRQGKATGTFRGPNHTERVLHLPCIDMREAGGARGYKVRR